MVEEISRRILFFRVAFLKGEKVVEPVKVFKKIHDMPHNPEGRHLSLSHGNAWTCIVDQCEKDETLRARLGTLRRSGLPDLHRAGEVKPLQIDPDASLLEQSHFVIFPDNTLACEYNHYAPRPTSIETYLLNKVPSLVDEVRLEAIVRRDVSDVLRKVKEVKSLTMRIHRDAEELARELDDNLPHTLAALKKVSPDAEYFEITIRQASHSRKPISLGLLARLPEWLGSPDNRGVLEKLEMQANYKEHESAEKFDLLNYYILSTKAVPKAVDMGKSVNTTAMYTSIEEAYDELEDEIKRGQGR